MTDLEAAEDALRAALPRGWVVGRPVEHTGEGRYVIFAYDPAERPKVGKRTRALEVSAPTELDAVREMAHGLSARA